MSGKRAQWRYKYWFPSVLHYHECTGRLLLECEEFLLSIMIMIIIIIILNALMYSWLSVVWLCCYHYCYCHCCCCHPHSNTDIIGFISVITITVMLDTPPTCNAISTRIESHTVCNCVMRCLFYTARRDNAVHFSYHCSKTKAPN